MSSVRVVATTPATAPHILINESRAALPIGTPSPFVFNLPAELLSLLVNAVAEIEAPRSPISGNELSNLREQQHSVPIWEPIKQGGTLGWIRLTHVCRKWRYYICEGMPLLWAQHVGCYRLPGSIEEMLRRAGGTVPLSVQSGSGGYADDVLRSPWTMIKAPISSWSPDECTSFRSRIRSLCVVDTRDGLGQKSEYDGLQSVLDDLSGIQTLDMVSLTLDRASLRTNQPPLPNECSLHASTLRVVRFVNCFIPWTTRGLTHLSISFIDIGVPSEALHHALEAVAPTIQELELDFCVPIEFLDREYTTYFLPQLRYLNTRDLDDYVYNVLYQIQIPASAKLSCTFIPADGLSTWVERSVTRMLSQLGSGAAYQFMSLTAILCEDPNGITERCRYAQLQFYKDIPVFQDQADEPSDRADLATAFEDAPDLDEDCWVGIAAVRNALICHDPSFWDKIGYLNLNMSLWKFPADAAETLGCLTNLRQLRLVNPFIYLSGDQALWSSPHSFSLLKSPLPHLDLLWVIQSASEWTQKMTASYCNTLTMMLKDATSFKCIEGNTPAKYPRDPPITLLRLDLVEKSGTTRALETEDLLTLFKGLTEKVDLRLVGP